MKSRIHYRGAIDGSIVTLALCAVSAAGAQQPDEVLFSDLYGSGNAGNSIVIQVPTDKVLVFDQSPPYPLKGLYLVVYAKSATIRANTTINSFTPGTSTVAPPTATPSTPSQAPVDVNGTGGSTGITGSAGNNCGRVVLAIDDLKQEGLNQLIVHADGEKGGTGGKGGQGGQGGPGHSGSDAGEFPCQKPCPEVGAPGRPGGHSGSGGVGGTGGNGCTVLLSSPLLDLLNRHDPRISVTVDGGMPGDSGDLGEPGIGGQGGARGAGSHSCTCNNPPGPAANGPAGPRTADPTPIGETGTAGSIVGL